MSDDPRRIIGGILSGDILEVGPGNDPFPVQAGARVRYADRSVEGGRDKNWPELAGSPNGPQADFDTDLDSQGLRGIEDRSLDALIASHVMEHLANPIAALLEFERVLRPGGRLVLVVPDRSRTFDAVRQSTPLAQLISKYHHQVTQVDDEEIREFCSAIYYQPPIHPPEVREWHNPQRLDKERLQLHRRRSIHVHCWGPEEFASLIAGVIAASLGSWKFAALYMPCAPRPQEFGLLLERGSSTGPEAAMEFVREWTTATLRLGPQHFYRIAAFACALHRDLAVQDRRQADAAIARVAGTLGQT